MFSAFPASDAGGIGLQDEIAPDGAYQHWVQVIDGAPYSCWYRLQDDGLIEVWTRGHHVIVPVEAVALLPEAVARAVLSKLAEGKTEAVVEAYQSSSFTDVSPQEQLFSDLEAPGTLLRDS